MGTRVPARL